MENWKMLLNLVSDIICTKLVTNYLNQILYFNRLNLERQCCIGSAGSFRDFQRAEQRVRKMLVESATQRSPLWPLFSSLSRLNQGTTSTEEAMGEFETFEADEEHEPELYLNTSHCGYLDMEKYSTIQSCTFWVEGIAMSVLGFAAIITNFISILVFSR